MRILIAAVFLISSFFLPVMPASAKGTVRAQPKHFTASSLPVLGHQLPRLRSSLPQLGRKLPQLSKRLPRLSRHIPRLRNTLPRLGNVRR